MRWGHGKNNRVCRIFVIHTCAVLNMLNIVVTFDTSHAEMSSLNVLLLKKRFFMSVTLLTHHVPIGQPKAHATSVVLLLSVIYASTAVFSCERFTKHVDPGGAHGTSLGEVDGDPLGDPDGDPLGASLGDLDGVLVGLSVGLFVGLFVGNAVGDSVGELVGGKEGGAS